jgi:hypothetical protein
MQCRVLGGYSAQRRNFVDCCGSSSRANSRSPAHGCLSRSGRERQQAHELAEADGPLVTLRLGQPRAGRERIDFAFSLDHPTGRC